MWMVAWGHGRAANGRANAFVALATGFTEFDVAVIQISNLPHGRVASLTDQADLARGHAHLCKVAFLGEQLCSTTGGTYHLTTATFFDLDVVDHGTDRDIRDRKRVPRANLGARSGHNCIANLEIGRRHNVTLLTVSVV